MLGQELCSVLGDTGLEYCGTDLEVSILESETLKRYAETHSPSLIVNCSAYTAVDKAEEDNEFAYKLNRDGVANIAAVASAKDIPVIHISTDYVFDGTSTTPLDEDEPVSPTSIYGKSKFAGEELLRKLCPKHVIIRTAWLYGKSGSNFVYTMVKLMNKLESIKVVSDQHGSPTWTRNIAELVTTIIRSGKGKWGTYHYSGEGETTWFGFAEAIYEKGKAAGLIASGCEINPCTSDEFPTKAKRPAYSLLSKEKVKNTFGVTVPGWEKSLGEFLNEFSSIHDRVSNWIEHADYDLETARAMHESGRYLYVSVTCQQSLEKAMKAVYEFKGKIIPRIHDLSKLSFKLGLLDSDKYGELLKDLTYYYIASRYNERIRKLSSEINFERSIVLIDKTEEALSCLKLMIPLS